MFSMNTGTFKTSTGVNTISGTLIKTVGSATTATGANQGAAAAFVTAGADIQPIIGVTGQGVPEVLRALQNMIHDQRQEKAA